jgi:sodium-dependent dicarboxylate transporter 2/3/5
MADSTPLLPSYASHLALGAAGSQCRESGDIQSFWRWLKGEKGKKMTVVVAGPLALVLVISFVRLAEGAPAVKMLGAVLWLAIWWLFEAVPICITALLPLVLFPFLQLMQADDVAEKYMNDTVVLMLGTFILALGIERFSLHKRIALKILLFFGGNPMDPRLVLLGFCIGPAFISMWMSNSAAAVMMIPMATGVLKHLNDEEDPNALLCRQCSRTFSRIHMKLDHGIGSTEVYNYDDDIVDPEAASRGKLVARGVVPEKVKRDFQVAVILAITYATAIGGLATLTGCGPNLVLPGTYSGRFPDAPKVTYLKWMMFALPLALPFLIFEWLLLCWLFCPLSSVPIIESKLSRTMMEQEYLALGPMNFAEKFIAGEFAVSSSHLLSGLTAYSSHFVLCVCTFVCVQQFPHTRLILNQMQRSILRRWKTFCSLEVFPKQLEEATASI